MAPCNETGIYRYKTFQSEKYLLRSNTAVETNNGPLFKVLEI